MGGPHDARQIAAAMNRAILSGDVAGVADAVNAAMQSAGSDGYFEIPTPDGGTARMSIQGLAQAVFQRVSAERDKVAQSMVNNNRIEGYMKELEMTDRDIKAQAAFAGVPLTQAGQMQVQAARTTSMRLMEAAAANPEKAAEYQMAAAEVMQRARDAVAQEMGGRLSPELAESLRLGHFSSASAHKSALVGAVGFGEAGPRAHDPIGQRFFAMMKKKEISPRQFREWAADGSAGLDGLGISPSEVFSILEDVNLELLSSVALETLTSNPKYQQVFRPNADGSDNPVLSNMARNIENLTSLEFQATANITPKEALSRAMSIVRLADEMLAMQDEQAAMSGQGGGSYRRGELLQAIQDQFTNSDVVRQFLQADTLSKESAALYNEIITYYNPGTAKSGDGATPFSQMGEMVAGLSMNRLANTLAGEQLTSLAGIRVAALRNAYFETNWSERARKRVDSDPVMRTQRQMAAMAVAMDKMADPDAFRSGSGWLPESLSRLVPSWGMATEFGEAGVPRASFAWNQPLATPEEVRAKLIQMGVNPGPIMGDE